MCSAYSQTVYQRVWRHPSENFLAEKKSAKTGYQAKNKGHKMPALWGMSSLPRWIILFSKVWVKSEVDDPRLTVTKI